MKKVSTILKHAQFAARKKDYEKAVYLLETIKDAEYLPSIYYVMKYVYISLTDITRYSFLDMRHLLENALKEESNNIDALIELGYFYSTIMNDDEKGLPFFIKACKLIKKKYAEALVGICEMDKKDYADFLEIEIADLRKIVQSNL
ncbi:hypothetical protein [Stenoxybacter acetivorans]|uniref:hypothetical protein n=1 Tax=Stenoxybacter acetivorans TaxID=422441 RepID=UPI00056B9754|nr:hypothetical protein [Stenoxybacter acetivorans]